ncbi:MAG TPA: S8 family serine peptidase [Dyella sp.]|uniref:S8 family serine peptidase n=1 Tax=Dyella sp. TaxID=1869338 RepID=UPI002F9471A2
MAVRLSRLALALLSVSLPLSIHADPAQAPRSGYELDLGGKRFDPLHVPIKTDAAWVRTQAEGDDFHLVQFHGPVQQPWLDALRSSGLEPVQYIHPYTYVVWGKRSHLVAASRQAQVRWSGDFLPAYRMQGTTRHQTRGMEDVRVLVRPSSAAARTAMASRQATTSTVTEPGQLQAHTLRTDANGIVTLARTPGVYSIQTLPKDGGSRGELSNMLNRDFVQPGTRVAPTYLQALQDWKVDGDGVVIANVDQGIEHTHPDLTARMLPCEGTTCGHEATSFHGTHTAAIMAGDGRSGAIDRQPEGNFLRGLGVAPGAQLVEQIYGTFFLQPGGMALLMKESVRNGAIISGNSWGPGGSPRGYDNDTRQVDAAIRDADPDQTGDQPLAYVLSFMNGNGGTQTQGSPDESKNAFTIGSTKAQLENRSQDSSVDDLSANTAHGPALDGRRIPHMVAPGCWVDSAATGGKHGLDCGTSMASPAVAGAAALFVQKYRLAYDATPSPALIKAAFTAAARDLAGGADADGKALGRAPDSKQGWGRMQLDSVLAPKTKVLYVDQTHVFENSGETWRQQVEADDPNLPVRIMLAWTDAPGHGLGGTTPAWNNNLDLHVKVGDTDYWGNALGEEGWSVSNGEADAKNNLEGVFLSPEQLKGELTLEVVASDINSDGLPNQGDDTDQDFALVCYNCK